MIALKTILLTIAIVSIAILALSIRIVLMKDGKFPETHISKNKAMKKKGINCVKAMDKAEQDQYNGKNPYKKVSMIK